ncbi:MAG: hypothetical protein E6J98_07655, partial [Methanobacteriota archaeon]
CLEDRFAEPVRAPFLDGYAEARSAALKAGATGFGLCGSGSSVFAFAPNSGVAGVLAEAMCDAFRSRGHAATPLATAVDNRVPSAGLLPSFGRRFSVLAGRGPPSIRGNDPLGSPQSWLESRSDGITGGTSRPRTPLLRHARTPRRSRH